MCALFFFLPSVFVCPLCALAAVLKKMKKSQLGKRKVESRNDKNTMIANTETPPKPLLLPIHPVLPLSFFASKSPPPKKNEFKPLSSSSNRGGLQWRGRKDKRGWTVRMDMVGGGSGGLGQIIGIVRFEMGGCWMVIMRAKRKGERVEY